MSDEELWASLSASPPYTAELATARMDGSPHVAPIRFSVLEGTVELSGELLVRLRPAKITSAADIAR